MLSGALLPPLIEIFELFKNSPTKREKDNTIEHHRNTRET
jgi:hypothetical protein